MRIAIATWTNRLAGGVETYLAAVIPALQQRGHEVAMLHEVDEPHDRLPVATSSVPQWCAAEDPRAAVESLRAWKPDVLFANGMDSPELERRAMATAPSVFFAHAYRGTCVSGTKSFRLPHRASCHRTLGWPCLAHYLPRQCGGYSPATMVRLYRRESERRELLPDYAAVVAFSDHMRDECVRHGVAPARTSVLPAHVGSTSSRARDPYTGLPDRVLFVGRMEPLKGAGLLLDALPLAEQILGRPLHAKFAGDGTERRHLEARARAQTAEGCTSRIEFTGWLGADARDRLFASSDLLVVPSVWPEPFGLVGIEAAAFGVPAAAFDVGGISQWLSEGVNGHLAAADPPSARPLAAAIARCLADRAHHGRLADGARKLATSHTPLAHVAALEQVLLAAASRGQILFLARSSSPGDSSTAISDVTRIGHSRKKQDLTPAMAPARTGDQ
jgi:glycosyltransferase involved in cell wall biosynthesis